MLPLSQIRAVPPDMPAVEAIEMLSRENAGPLAVILNGNLEGIVSRGQVVRFLQLYSGLKGKAA